MRKIYILLFTLAAAYCFAGCTREDAVETTGNGDVIIRLEVDGLETKSAANAHENYVENLQVLVFEDVNNAPTKYLTPSITAGAGPFEQSYATLSDFGGFTATELENATVFAVANYSGDLSGVTSLADAKAQAVNADGFLENTSEGWDIKDAPRFVMTAQGSFVMGTGTDAGKAVANLTLRRLASKVSINITYASLDPEHPITTEDEANKTKTVWTPMTEGNVRVYLANAVNNGKLEGYADTPDRFTYTDNHPEGEGTLSSAPFYTYPTTWSTDSDDAPYIKIIQPWSYTTVKYEGTSASPSNPVVIDQNVVELYYKVMFPGITALAANTWYQPTVTLNVLGGESNRNMVELSTTGFDILPWGTVGSGAGELSAIEIEPAKYIAVEREHTIVNNGGTVSIKYVASGATTLTVEKIHKMVYGNTAMIEREIYPTKDAAVNDDYAGAGGTGSIASGSTSDPWFGNSYGDDLEKPNEGTITLKHTLSSVFGVNNFAARPYIYKLKLHLNGESTELDKIFYITQNPSILVEGTLSTGWVSINNATSNFSTLYRARTSSTETPTVTHGSQDVPLTIETNSSSQEMQQDLGFIYTYSYLDPSDENSCHYRLLISVSPKAGLYILDPRIDLSGVVYDPSAKVAFYNTGNALNGIINTHRNGTSTASADRRLEGSALSSDSSEQSAIKKYRPAERGNVDGLTSTTYRPEITPQFMVASSYGKGSNLSYRRAVLRCAAYQEDGYPAGRWRLPTEAEIEYCLDLQRTGAIPQVFSSGKDDYGYWASTGRYYGAKGSATKVWVDSNSDLRGLNAYARCVYDTWYWGKEEVDDLKLGKGTTFGTDFSVAQYKWSGYMTTK